MNGGKEMEENRQPANIAWSPIQRSALRWLLILVAGACLEIAPAVGAAQQGTNACPVDACKSLCSDSSRTVVCIDQTAPKGQRVTLHLANGAPRSLSEDREVEAPIKEELAVEVCNTQTALFDYSVTTKAVDLGTLAELQSFTKGAKAYLAEAATSLGGAALAMAPAPSEVELQAEVLTPACSWSADQAAAYTRIESDYRAVNPMAILSGLAGFMDQIGSLSFDARRYAQVVDVEESELRDVDREARARLSAAMSDGRLELYAEMSDLYSKLPGLIQQATSLPGRARSLASSLGSDCMLQASNLRRWADSAEAFVKATTDSKFADTRDKALDAALTLESEIRNLVCSCPAWQAPAPIKVKWDTAQKVSVAVTRKKAPELARATTDKKPLDLDFTLTPDRAWRPQVSLALLYTDSAEYASYGTKKVGDQFEIVQKDVSDKRASYGLGLATTFRGLDHRATKGWAFWPIEIYLNPSDSDRALGAGIAVSWKGLKVSVGGLWTRHKVLDGLELGQMLASDDDFKTRDSYGQAELYVGISVVGWQPFKP
jgi:hypothetical protein